MCAAYRGSVAAAIVQRVDNCGGPSSFTLYMLGIWGRSGRCLVYCGLLLSSAAGRWVLLRGWSGSCFGRGLLGVSVSLSPPEEIGAIWAVLPVPVGHHLP